VSAPARRVVRERIDPRLTASLFANYRSAIDALLELVDNAVDSRVAGHPLRLDLVLRPGTVSLTVVGGTGMDARRLERDYLRWGASSKRSGERIGRYGQGGKAAIGHLGNRFRIIASAQGESVAHAFADDDYRDRSRLRSYELHEEPKPVGPDLGYVNLVIGAVDRKLDPARVRSRLGDVYRPLLVEGAVVMTVDRSPVTPVTWRLDEEHRFRVRAGGHLVEGWWGLLPEPVPPQSVPGIRTYHLGRLVGDPAWFGHPGPNAHPALCRLVGEVELSHVPVTMNKSDLDQDSAQYAAVERRLHQLLGPAVRRLSKEEVVATDPQAKRTAERVRRILARALRLLESGQLFESPNTGGKGDAEGDGQLTLQSVHEPQDFTQAPESGSEDGRPEAAGRSHEPPASIDAGRSTGGSKARRGFGDIVIRPLDPRVRSAMVEEDGVLRVVINPRYPLYDVRRGDLWYQLETALREVCATLPEATIPEFERKVNELMLVSLAFTERRVRRPGPGRTVKAGL
jgi:hypothetical protein